MYGADEALRGFSDDLIYQAMSAAGLPVKIISIDSMTPTQILDAKMADVVLTAHPITPSSTKLYDFSNPYFVSGPVVVVAKNAPYTSLKDLQTGEIAIDRNVPLAISEEATAHYILRPYESVFLAIEDVVKGKLDGAVVNFILATRFARGFYEGKIKILLPPVIPLGVRCMVKKGMHQEFMQAFNEQLLALRKSKNYDKMLAYWGLGNGLGEP